MLIGQAPGVREPVLKRPFAHTAGKTLFRWFEEFCGLSETELRQNIYFAPWYAVFFQVKRPAVVTVFEVHGKFRIVLHG